MRAVQLRRAWGVVTALAFAGCASSSEAQVTAPGPELLAGADVEREAAPAVCEQPDDPGASQREAVATFVAEHYEKSTYMVPMRDGAKLFTVVYRPTHVDGPVPVLMHRTP